MGKYTVVAIKRILAETSIEAKSQKEALTKAKELNSSQFIDLENEISWKVTGAYQNHEASSL